MLRLRTDGLCECEPQYQYSKRQSQNCSYHYQKIGACPVFRSHNLDQDSTQSCDGDIDQVANGKLRRLEMARIAVVLLFGLVVTGIALYGFASGSFA